MYEQKPPEKDPFTRLAITFILGVLLGFTLLLMSFIFFILALLTTTVENPEFPAWGWFLLGIVSITVGIWMMRKQLSGTPAPGTYK